MRNLQFNIKLLNLTHEKYLPKCMVLIKVYKFRIRSYNLLKLKISKCSKTCTKNLEYLIRNST